MEQIEDQKIEIEKDGKKIECDLLFTFDSPDTGKTYMAYTDHTKDELGSLNMYVYSYDPVLGIVDVVTDEAEAAMTNDVIKDISKGIFK